MAEILKIKTPDDLGDAVLVQQKLDGGVLRLVLNNPPANTLSEAMLAAMKGALEAAESDSAVRVIIIAANGHLFCAGHDLKELSTHREDPDRGRAYFDELMEKCATVMQAIVNHPKPVIAEVNGLATAAGCQLVASADLAIASEDATFCTSGVHIGLFCSTPMVALSRNVARKHAMEMLLTGEMIPAARAAEIGLVNAVVDDAELTPHVTAVAHNIASKSPVTLAIGKSAFYTQRELPIADAYEYASRVMVENMLHRDAVEGIDAFIEKREPKW